MFRSLISEILLPLLLFFLLRSVLRNLFAPRSAAPARSRAPQPDVSAGGELKKDPVCGIYVSVAAGVREKVNGQVVYFCSEACRGKFKG